MIPAVYQYLHSESEWKLLTGKFTTAVCGVGKKLVLQVSAVVRSLVSFESTLSNGCVVVVCPHNEDRLISN